MKLIVNIRFCKWFLQFTKDTTIFFFSLVCMSQYPNNDRRYTLDVHCISRVLCRNISQP